MSKKYVVGLIAVALFSSALFAQEEPTVTEHNRQLTGLAKRIENLTRVAEKMEKDGKTEQAARLRERIKQAEARLAQKKEDIASGKGKGKPERAGKPDGKGKPEGAGKGKPEGAGKGKPEGAGKGKPEGVGKGKPENAGKGKPENAGKGKPESAGKKEKPE